MVVDGWGMRRGSDQLVPLTAEQSRRIADAFEQGRDHSGFVSRENGKRQLERTNIAADMLQAIWHMSDLDRDGRLSLREFACALNLAELVAAGHPLPVEVSQEKQSTMAKCVEPFLQRAADSPVARVSSTSDGIPDFMLGPPSPTSGSPIAGSPSDGKKLSQLALILQACSSEASVCQLEDLTLKIVQERHDLQDQLGRRRDHTTQLEQVSSALEDIRNEGRKLDIGNVVRQHRISSLQQESMFIDDETRSAAEDLRMLRSVTGSSREPTAGNSASTYQQNLLDKSALKDLRAQARETAVYKKQVQEEQLHLIEAQRHNEHDRGLMQLAIETEQAKLSALRERRLKLRQEKISLELELVAFGGEAAAANFAMGVKKGTTANSSKGVPAPPKFMNAVSSVNGVLSTLSSGGGPSPPGRGGNPFGSQSARSGGSHPVDSLNGVPRHDGQAHVPQTDHRGILHDCAR